VSSSQSSTPAARIAFVVFALILAGLGLTLGMRLRGRTASPSLQEALVVPPKLAPGNTFPDAPVQTEDGETRMTRALLEGKGGVVIFVDVECAPCSVMTRRYQDALDHGGLAAVPVLGISAAPLDAIRSYRAAKGLTFPVYCDATSAFAREYGVASYPLLLVVGRSLTIRSFTYDSRSPIEPDRLLGEIER
jgi:peroxiredoxin